MMLATEGCLLHGYDDTIYVVRAPLPEIPGLQLMTQSEYLCFWWPDRV